MKRNKEDTIFAYFLYFDVIHVRSFMTAICNTRTDSNDGDVILL